MEGDLLNDRKNCVYCGHKIEKKSREHIIQNALGGLYESEEICCEACNNYVSKYIDVPFTKIFNPIISNIENFTKTNNKKSKPLCTGKALYNNKLYNVSIKDGKVVACQELSRELKCDVSKLHFDIVAYDFPIENTAFKNGICKIAFNFALDKGVSLEILKKGLDVKKRDDKIESISFDYPIIPFIPLNPMDKYIETDTSMELYHNLILFNQDNKLWCYVDLFNTFQYYVLLSEKWNQKETILETYLQLLQKIERNIPDLYIRRPKDIIIMAQLFDIEPCLDLDKFNHRLKVAIQKESVKKNMSDVLSAKLGADYFKLEKWEKMSKEDARTYLQNDMGFDLKSLLLYFDENDHLKESTFRQVTIVDIDNNITVSYPELIKSLLMRKQLNIQEYTFKKFERLNKFLSTISGFTE